MFYIKELREVSRKPELLTSEQESILKSYEYMEIYIQCSYSHPFRV